MLDYTGGDQGRVWYCVISRTIEEISLQYENIKSHCRKEFLRQFESSILEICDMYHGVDFFLYNIYKYIFNKFSYLIIL